MARYIDIEPIEMAAKDGGYCTVSLSLINEQPTADVVEVVRCKDCVHHKNAPKTTDVWCDRLDGLLPKDWFCADGERRTENAEIH